MSLLLAFFLILPWYPVRAAEPALTLYSFSLPKAGGGALPLSEYKGKVVIIVNLASKSTFADQLPALEKLAATYKDQGLVVLGVPSNDFGAEEPGDDTQIQKWCSAQHVNFPVMAKSSVRGKDELPLYAFLTAAGAPAKLQAKTPAEGHDIHWNYTKFILTRDGQVGARFEPDTAPDSPEFEIAVQQALAGKLKLKSADAPPSSKAQAAEPDDNDGL